MRGQFPFLEDFDCCESVNQISAQNIEILSDKLKDIVDRLYYCDEDQYEIDNEELDCSIRSVCHVLDVKIPDHQISIKAKICESERVAKIINHSLYSISKIYSGWSPSSALSFLIELKIKKGFELLTVGDIADFCYSEYFIKKCEEYGNVL